MVEIEEGSFGVSVGGRGQDVPSISFPRYTWPDVISRVTTWFWKSAGSIKERAMLESFGMLT